MKMTSFSKTMTWFVVYMSLMVISGTYHYQALAGVVGETWFTVVEILTWTIIVTAYLGSAINAVRYMREMRERRPR